MAETSKRLTTPGKQRLRTGESVAESGRPLLRVPHLPGLWSQCLRMSPVWANMDRQFQLHKATRNDGLRQVEPKMTKPYFSSLFALLLLPSVLVVVETVT